MTNVSHATMTGANLHEPKGVSTASFGTVYVANGAGSGAWADVGSSALTGMVADFLTPLAPAGWLELDGSVVSTTTYANLYSVMTIPTTGTRSSGSAVITSIPDTSILKVGYYVFGTGIATNITIQSIDSSTQVTLTGNASSSGTAAIFVSPWLLATGTIKLPDVKTSGRYRRSRTSGTQVGQLLADQNQAHTHDVSGTSGSESAHTHTYSGNTGVESASHTHAYVQPVNSPNQTGGGGFPQDSTTQGASTGSESNNHTHAYSGTVSAGSAHTHSFAATSTSNGGTEARPLSIVCITCVKT